MTTIEIINDTALVDSLPADLTAGMTDEQVSALGVGVRLIEAGPGAGKTRTIVSRFRHRARLSNRGIALLSFTNAAVDEATARCLAEPGILASPNFVGTFDQFFHRYVVTPHVVATTSSIPRYLASWDDLPDDLSIVRPTAGMGIRLSRFVSDSAGTMTLDSSKLNHGEKQYLAKITQYSIDKLAPEATRRRNYLLNMQIFDTNAARELTLRLLADSTNPVLVRLKARFEEIIVDEFQDCDDTEHALLALLTAAEIRVVAVADPDQAIYEFRQSAGGLYESFRTGLPSESRVDLSVCFRSTPAICLAISSLRTIGAAGIVAHASAGNSPEHIFVVVGSGTKATRSALSIAGQAGVPIEDIRVLAHRRSDARRLVRSGVEAPGGVSYMEKVISAIVSLKQSNLPRTRLSAIRTLERCLLDLVDWPVDAPRGDRERELEILGIRPAELRMIVSKVVANTDEWTSEKACSEGFRAVVTDEFAHTNLALRADYRRTTAAPKPKVWAYWTKCTDGLVPEREVEVAWANIHGVKGAEFEGVVLVLPSSPSQGGTHVVDDWEADVNSEQRRVLYVGASRAKRLLVLVVPPGRAEQLKRILARDHVAFQSVNAT